jgi:proteasome accessory factor B
VAAGAVPVEERLFSLVLALVATDHGLTKAEILSSVQGYRHRYVVRGDNASLERQFERDKDDIRDLGVPLETIEQATEAGNNQNLRYRIPKGAYDLPPDVTFTPEETTLLNLAAEVWREGSLSSESHRALLKLRSLGIEVDGPMIGYAPRVRVREAAFEPLRSAIDRNLVVTFAYLKPGERAAVVRTVEPLALVKHEGRWHVATLDRDRAAPRTFLLSRIVGPVTPTRTTFSPPEGDSAAAAVQELDRVLATNVARIRVRPDSDADSRLRRQALEPSADTDLRVNYLDANLMADELASYGPEVVVLEPSGHRAAVVDPLRQVAASHTGTDR